MGFSQKRGSDDRKKGFLCELSDEFIYIFYKIIKINFYFEFKWMIN